MKKEELEIIKNYLTKDEPFGPIDAKEIEDPKALQILFEHHNKIYKALHSRPSIVVGRKGSGKTSYLNAAFFDNGYTYISEIEAADVFTNVINSISGLSGGPVFAESVAKVWETILFVGLFGSIRKKLPITSKSRKFINDYLAKIGIRDGDTLDDILWQIADIVSEKSKDKTSGVIAELLKTLDNVTFKKTKEELFNELKSRNEKAVILLDSLDDFKLHLSTVGRAIQGLLKFVGESNKPSSPVDVRFCLPAELYHRFQAVSSNPNKDFRRKLLLHWVASELVMVASHRLNMYLKAHDKLGCISFSGKDDKKAARALLLSIMPKLITCKLGIQEDPLAYIFRHTQLLPRHLLIILNSICNKNRKYCATGDMVFTEEVPEQIRIGQTSRIRLQLGESKEGVLLTKGGFYQTTGGQWVFVLDESEEFAVKRDISIGRQNPRYYEVLGGLEPGEKVIVSSYQNYADHDKLRLKHNR